MLSLLQWKTSGLHGNRSFSLQQTQLLRISNGIDNQGFDVLSLVNIIKTTANEDGSTTVCI